MKKIFILIVTLLLTGGVIFLIDQKTDIIKNTKMKTVNQIKKDEIKYSFKNSSFYRNYYSKERLIVLNIWATWCKPCMEEIPTLNMIKKEYNNSQISFLSLSLDNDSLKLERFNSSKRFSFQDVTFENYLYQKSILNNLNANEDEISTSVITISSTEIPITYIIKNQKIIKRITGKIDKESISKIIDENLK